MHICVNNILDLDKEFLISEYCYKQLILYIMCLALQKPSYKSIS